jgi:hypothetical protein
MNVSVGWPHEGLFPRIRCFARPTRALSRNSILSTHSGKRARTYIVSQRHAGWVALGDMYDDGGLSGWTMERPALKRLLHRFDDGELTCGNIGTIPATIKIANMQRYRECPS